MRIAILTISDACSRGERHDASGDAIASWVAARGQTLGARTLIPDDTLEIVRALTAWCDNDEVDLVLTTGGTGLAPRDVTPEATRAVIERDAPGIAESLRFHGMSSTKHAMLSRGIAGVRHKTLIVNLPGSPRAVEDGLAVIEPVVEHAVKLIRGEPTPHAGGREPQASPAP